MRIIEWILNLEKRFQIALAAVLVLLLLLLLYPFKTVIVPSWPLRVVDDTERPIAGIKVTEHWQHYLLESEGHEELKSTDGYGAVDFPERTIRASLLRRGFAVAGKIVQQGFRGRWDCYGSIVVWGSKDHATTTAVVRPDTMPPEKIVVKRTYSYSRLTTKRNLLSEFGISSR